jgi:hypothetical protein
MKQSQLEKEIRALQSDIYQLAKKNKQLFLRRDFKIKSKARSKNC